MGQSEAHFLERTRIHERRAARFFRAELAKRATCRASVLNRLLFDLNEEERTQVRALGFIQQEWYVGR